MRAAPGVAPRAIALKSQRIDMPQTLKDTAARVAENRERRVNPGPAGSL
jgi:hypothetical protein